MVVSCSVKGCETVGKNGFHSFPRDRSTAGKWIFAAKAFHLVEKLNSNKLSGSFHKVCGKHFNVSDLTKNGKGQDIVKPGFVPPSLLLPNENDDNVPEVPPEVSKPIKPVKRLQQQQHSLTGIGKTWSDESGKNVGDGNPISKGGGRKNANRSKVSVRGYMLVIVHNLCVVSFCFVV